MAVAIIARFRLKCMTFRGLQNVGVGECYQNHELHKQAESCTGRGAAEGEGKSDLRSHYAKKASHCEDNRG